MSQTFCVTLPDIGEGVVEGEVIEWLKAEGDLVAQDEPVVVVMTDKATVELPAPYPGVISKHYHQPGEVAIRDQALYDIALEAPVAVGGGEARQPGAAPPPSPKKQEQVCRPKQGKVLATPATRHLAKELGVDINAVKGSGPNGRVLRSDLTRAPSKRRAGPSVSPGQSTPVWNLPGDREVPLIGFRNYIAEKMTEAKHLIPHFAYFDQADCSRLIQMRERSKAEAAKEGVKLTFMPFFIRALSLALSEFPEFNSSIDLDKRAQIIHSAHNIGIATKTDDGLIVPVLKGVQDMSFHDVIRSYDALRTKQPDPSDMKEATITISNFGSEGGQWATPIVNYPEACILGLARIRDQVVAYRGEVVVRPILNLSWCGDHRILDGDKMAKFSNLFIRLLENPGQLL